MKYVFKKLRYKVAISILDFVGNIIFCPIRFFRKEPPPNPKSILIVRLDHIGDFVCTTPIFKNLRKQFPGAKITALINSASKDMAFRDPNIDKVITFSPFYLERGERSSTFKGLLRVAKDIRNIGFDLGVESRGDILSIIIMWLGGVKYRVGYGITGGGFLLHKEGKYDNKNHIIERNISLLKEMGLPVEDTKPAVYFNDKDINLVDGMIRELKINKNRTVVLHPFAGAKAKEWPYSNFQSLVNRLKNDGWDVLLTGSEKDKGLLAGVIDIRGRFSLPQMAYLIKSVNFFIGLDSGPANIAAALNVRSVIICSGTNVPQLWIPNNSNVRFVCKDVECKPCENKVCPEDKKNKCMTSISVDDVMDAVKGLGV